MIGHEMHTAKKHCTICTKVEGEDGAAGIWYKSEEMVVVVVRR